MIRLLTAGESHGPELVVIVDGFPAGMALTAADVDGDLALRQKGHGRGGRMRIERDRVVFAGGVRLGRTTGAPIAMRIPNRDWEHWRDAMAVEPATLPRAARRMVTRPRPGHADLAGALKMLTHDARETLERASARETAARVAAGALCRAALRTMGIEIRSHTVGLGS